MGPGSSEEPKWEELMQPRGKDDATHEVKIDFLCEEK